MNEFCRYELRTTDAAAARTFYARVFGHDRAVIWPLHEQALARGARPHWLGYLGVENVEQGAAAFLARGAMRLGPAPATQEGGQAATVLRDPGGALLGLATPPPRGTQTSVDVVWHVLNTNDMARAATNYTELFGWAVTETLELGAVGTFRQFAWHAGGRSVGAMADVAGRTGVHTHWLFFFAVDALEPAMATVRAAGGRVLDPMVTPTGERICVCDDPQGAAFALIEQPRA